MTIEHPLEIVYQKAKEASLGLISNKEASAFLVSERNFNASSAVTVIQVFQKMLNGERFTRTLSVEYFEYYLYRIYTDFGIAKLDTALNSLNKHIFYIKTKGDSKVKLKSVIQKYSQKVLLNENAQKEIEIEDENEQEEIAQTLQGKSKAEVAAELKNANPIEPEIVVVNGRAYKRDNKIIAQIKFVRDYKCQICSSFILKANGKKYIEAAHIVAKSLRGAEIPSNIILLCPNHHKEFDLGNRKILLHDENKVHFILNGMEFEIKF
jgi:predicted restriction endonuclease